MKPNNSPWLHQLNRTRSVDQLASNTMTDIAVVGGGIAGITTAYFLLKNTDKKVTLIEGGKVAHGATGHNAGQVTSYFERQISEIAKEFGNELTVEAQMHVESAWGLLEGIFEDAQLTTSFHQFTGYAGSSDFDEVMIHIKNSALANKMGIKSESLMIAEEWSGRNAIPHEYEDLYTVVPQKDILSLLETEDTQYISLLSSRKGVTNSALFCEELVGYLLLRYADRFTLREESPVYEVVLEQDSAKLKIKEFIVTCEKVVLCTNGFEKFKITNNAGRDIDTKFHHTVRGVVGYMAGYLAPHDKSPMALSYIGKDVAYFYLTRRPFEDNNEKYNLICAGGPEISLEDTSVYSRDEHLYPSEAEKEIDDFLHRDYKDAPKEIQYTYQWHGLMGDTPNRVRLIGTEPLNPVLLYNLGCNGIGILPSVYGAKRISQIIAGEKLKPSIFDPKENI
jgi:glycine/D-amino acid oxidase-like deaminating enzyme